MALTATATQGFEFDRCVAEGEVLWVPGDPGDTYAPGDLVSFNGTAGEGIADAFAADEQPYGVVVAPASFVCTSDVATGFPRVDPLGATKAWASINDSAATKTLVPIRPLVPVGTPVMRATFASHVDDTVITYLASTPYIAATTGNAADDYPNGALIYIYEGPGVGEWSVVADYDHTGGAVELEVILHRAFPTTLTSASKYIVLSGEAATNKGVGFFGRCTGDTNNLVVNNGANDGGWTVFISAQQVQKYLSELKLPVIPSSLLLFA